MDFLFFLLSKLIKIDQNYQNDLVQKKNSDFKLFFDDFSIKTDFSIKRISKKASFGEETFSLSSKTCDKNFLREVFSFRQ